MIRKVLILGSGALKIGEAGEFDYSGSQALKALREEGIRTVLVNPNIATVQTSEGVADEVYFLPVTPEFVEKVIKKERPDGILLSFGGQTALNCGVELFRSGVLKRYGVEVLGTPVETIIDTEDRELFVERLDEIGVKTIRSHAATTLEEARAAAREVGYPVIIRAAYALGGLGSGFCENEAQLDAVAQKAFTFSPQVLVEKSLRGWKEIEYEVVRDRFDNCITVCNMENVDPLGIHTGESIVVAPSQTLTNDEYHFLRKKAIDIVRHLGIVGECNVQYAFSPDGEDYRVIEVNARLSRSSALASKATGYPIAKMSTRIALGYTLDEIKNDITGKTCACFEPTIDYVVVKFPKWPFEKFHGASRRLGTQMKATGEVMAIAPSFEMALMKAVRGAELGLDTLNAPPLSDAPVRERLAAQDDRRIFTVFEALKAGVSVDEIFNITKIDRWFLWKLQGLAAFEAHLKADGLSGEDYKKAKRLGYTDEALCRLCGVDSVPGMEMHYKMVDTCGAEFEAETPYFYSTFDSECESRLFPRSGKPVVMVLGSGPIRIGQGIEFDYSSVRCVWTLKKLGYDVVIVNNNPETVSTDYDTADRLYFEPLCREDVWNIVQLEKPVGVVVAFGGQTAIKLTEFLDKKGVQILGTSADSIDTAEDRARFDTLLERFGIRRPRGHGVLTLDEAVAAAEDLGYPVLLRPSYVIGGQNMCISRDRESTVRYMNGILAQGIENPVLVDKYMPGTELEVDVISDGEDVLIPGIMEHIERAGVHSGDSIAVYPPWNLSDKFLKRIADVSEKLALALGTKGLVNIQYLIWQDELYVIEVNPRASRTVPYISKVTDVPMVDLASRIMLGAKLRDLGWGTGLYRTPPYYAVKVPVFSFEKLSDANSILGPEMKSTGEVLGIGRTLAEALFKGLTAAGFKLPERYDAQRGVLISVENEDSQEILSLARRFYKLGLTLYATTDTAAAIASLGIPVVSVQNAGESGEIEALMDSGALRYLVYTGAVKDGTMGDYIALHRRAMQRGVPCLTSLDTANALAEIIESRFHESSTELVDINAMRTRRQLIRFTKMQDCGNDYIFIENFDGAITCPESLCVNLCRPHTGVGSDGIVLIEKSKIADVRMRSFNRDGSEGKMAGNNIRCVAKYVYDRGIVSRERMTVETGSGVKSLRLFLRDGKVSSVEVDMGKASLKAAEIPVVYGGETVVDAPVTIGGADYRVTCVNVGNPHCVVFCDAIDGLDLEKVGPLFEHDAMFPERVNAEFVRVVNRHALRMRVWERGSGETLACGTGACAAVVAACENGLCDKGSDVKVSVLGGELTVNYTDARVLLTGGASVVYEGQFEY